MGFFEWPQLEGLWTAGQGGRMVKKGVREILFRAGITGDPNCHRSVFQPAEKKVQFQ